MGRFCPVLFAVFLVIGSCTAAAGEDRTGFDATVDRPMVIEQDHFEDAQTPTDASVQSDVGDSSTRATDAPTACGCFDGDGTYCTARIAEQVRMTGCSVPVSTANSQVLYRCTAGRWTVAETCSAACNAGETDATDECALPACPCFVRVSWCGASAARHGLTLDPPCAVPLSPLHDDDLIGCNGDRWVVLQECARGCFEAAVGTPDHCVDVRTPRDPGWAACADRALLKAGLHPEASNRMRCAGLTSGDQISQTIGNAPASAGYHLLDGRVSGTPYCAATDIRTGGMSEAQIRALLERLALNGFAPFYRKPGFDGWPANGAPHIHAVFAGVVMKPELRGQVRDFFAGRNGLSSHTLYRFWQPTPAAMAIVRLLFQRNY